jgi:hypothetical protein
MTVPANSGHLNSRLVLIEGREWPKPWDPTCPVCISPWLVSIDEMLAEGYTFSGIRAVLRGRKPGPPSADAIYRAHIEHLAEPHRKTRAGLEQGEGDEPASLVDIAAATRAVVSRGFAALASGRMEVSSKDLIAALRLQSQLEREEAGGMDSGRWQAAFVEFLTLARQHMPPGNWQAFVAAAQDSPAIRLILTDSPALPQGAPNG